MIKDVKGRKDGDGLIMEIMKGVLVSRTRKGVMRSVEIGVGDCCCGSVF